MARQDLAAHSARKRHFLSHFYIKCIILPRQARDKHRETTQKKCHFPSGGVGVLAVLVVLLLVWFWNSRWVMVTKQVVGLFFGSTVLLDDEKTSDDKTGSGQTHATRPRNTTFPIERERLNVSDEESCKKRALTKVVGLFFGLFPQRGMRAHRAAARQGVW
jgi:hypothetical protein